MKGNHVTTIAQWASIDDFLAGSKPLRSEGYEWFGPMDYLKGDETVKAQEKQQFQFNSQMMGIFNQQFQQQSQVLQYLKGKMQPMIDNPTGYNADALAAMRTQATDQLSQQYQSAQQALNSEQAQKGGNDLPSGVNASLDAALLNQEATDKANAQSGITLQNENLKQANYWNALNVLSGVGAQFNPQSYASDYNQGSSNMAGLSKAYMDSKQGFWSSFKNSLGSALGNTLGGSSISGGGGKSMSYTLCWVAAAIYGGWYAPETSIIRWKLLEDESLMGRITLGLYRKFGPWVASKPVLVKLVTPLFNRWLREATEVQ